jgi:protein O-mannosyl-transferase
LPTFHQAQPLQDAPNPGAAGPMPNLHDESPPRSSPRGDKPLLSDNLATVCLALALIFVVFTLLAVGLHHRGFQSPMMYDDLGWIQNRAHVFEAHNVFAVASIVPARPLFMASLYLNYLLTGMDPSYFRWTNALMLGGTGLVLVLVCMTVFEIPGLSAPGSTRERRGVCLVLGVLFVVHPLQTFVVLYIWQREALMGCCFYLAALGVYLVGRSRASRIGAPVYVCTAALFFAGMLSKENVVTLPLVLLLSEITLFRQDLRGLTERVAPIVILTGLPLAAYLLLMRSLGSSESAHTAGAVQRLVEYYRDAGINPVEVALTQSRVWFSYLFMILAPPPSGLPLLKAEIISRSLWSPPVTLSACIAVSGLLATGLALVRKRPVASFGIFFSLIVSAPEAFFIPQYLFCGYRAILPMVGVLLVLGDGILYVAERGRDRFPNPSLRLAAMSVLIVPVLYLSVVTVGQAGRWDPLLFWQAQYSRLPPISEDVEYRPYADILANYGQELIAAGRYREAVKVLKQAATIGLRENPSTTTFHIGTGSNR